LLTVALARAGLIWDTTGDTGCIAGSIGYPDCLPSPGFAPTDSGFAMISPFADDPNTSGGGAPGGSNSGGNGGPAGNSGDPNNSGSTGDPGGGSGGSTSPEPGTLILTGVGIGTALLLTRSNRRTTSNSPD
jgi:hypothetical protein